MKDQLLHAPYLAAPAGVLLFIDAASIPAVRGLLDGSAPQNFNSVDPHIVSTAGRVMRDYNDDKVDVPVAVVVSRADLLLRSPAFAEFHPYLGQEPLLDEAAMFQARQFVSRYADGFSTATAMAFGGERVRYFFASATGESPVGGRFGAVRPWGCLGPLLWLLKQIGFAA
jgi:hypothetical protein